MFENPYIEGVARTKRVVASFVISSATCWLESILVRDETEVHGENPELSLR